MYQGWRRSWGWSVYQSQRQQLNENTVQYCGSNQFPENTHQFLHNEIFLNIKLKVSTSYYGKTFIVCPKTGHYLIFSESQVMVSQSEKELVNSP